MTWQTLLKSMPPKCESHIYRDDDKPKISKVIDDLRLFSKHKRFDALFSCFFFFLCLWLHLVDSLAHTWFNLFQFVRSLRRHRRIRTPFNVLIKSALSMWSSTREKCRRQWRLDDDNDDDDAVRSLELFLFGHKSFSTKRTKSEDILCFHNFRLQKPRNDFSFHNLCVFGQKMCPK